MAFATIDLTKGITGSIPTANLPTIPVTKGGTNLTSGTTDQFLKFTGTTTLASAADNAGIFNVIRSAAFSSVDAYMEMTSAFNSTYRNYYIKMEQLKQNTGHTKGLSSFLKRTKIVQIVNNILMKSLKIL